MEQSVLWYPIFLLQSINENIDSLQKILKTSNFSCVLKSQGVHLISIAYTVCGAGKQNGSTSVSVYSTFAAQNLHKKTNQQRIHFQNTPLLLNKCIHQSASGWQWRKFLPWILLWNSSHNLRLDTTVIWSTEDFKEPWRPKIHFVFLTN